MGIGIRPEHTAKAILLTAPIGMFRIVLESTWMCDPATFRSAVCCIDRLVIYETVRKWARAILLVCSLWLLILISLAVFGFEAWLALAEWLAIAYAGLAVWYGSYRSSFLFLIAGSVLLATLTFSRAARGGLDTTLAIVAGGLAVTVLVSELLYRSELGKVGGGHALAGRPQPSQPASSLRPLPIAAALGQKLLALLLVLVAVVIIIRGNPLLLGLAAVFLIPLIRGRLRRAKRLEALAGREAVELDKRPPVLILRSFRDDEIRAQGAALVVQAEAPKKDSKDEKPTLEERLSTAVSGRGPVIALGVPGENVRPLGAARDYVAANDWQNAIRQMMCDAQAIVVIAGSSPGLAWELAEIRQHGFLAKTIVAVPSPVKAVSSSTGASEDKTVLTLFARRTDVEPGVDAEGRIRAVLQALGIGDSSALEVAVDSVRAFVLCPDGLMAFVSRFRGVKSVMEALKAAVTHIPEPQRCKSLSARPSHPRTTALLVGTEPRVGSSAALAVLAGTPLLFFTGIVEAAGILQTSAVAETLLAALFAVNLALLCTGLFCWLVKFQGRYVCGREFMDDVLKGLAVSLLPLLVALTITTLTTVISGKDGFRFVKVAWLSGMSELSGWQLALGALVFGCVPWVFVRFLVRLRHLWGGSLRAAALSVGLCAFVSLGLFFAGHMFASAELSGGISQRFQRGPETEKERQEKQDAAHKLCRDFGPDREADVIRWGSSLHLSPAEALILTDEESRITGYRFCVSHSVPLWVLLRAECKYRLAVRRSVPATRNGTPSK